MILASAQTRPINEDIKANLLQSELHELEEIKGLVTKGQQQGVLSYNEVADALAEIDLDEIGGPSAGLICQASETDRRPAFTSVSAA